MVVDEKLTNRSAMPSTSAKGSSTLKIILSEKLTNDFTLLQARMEKIIVSHLIKANKELTPQQKKKFRTIVQRGFMIMPPEGPDRDRHGESLKR